MTLWSRIKYRFGNGASKVIYSDDGNSVTLVVRAASKKRTVRKRVKEKTPVLTVIKLDYNYEMLAQ